MANKRARKKLLRKYGSELRGFNAINEHVQALKRARDQIYSVSLSCDASVHVDNLMFEEFLSQSGNQYKVEKRESVFPFEVSFYHDDVKYHAIYTEKEFKNKFGGNKNECTGFVGN